VSQVIRSKFHSPGSYGDFGKIVLLSALLFATLLISLFNVYLGATALGLLLTAVVLGLNLRCGFLALLFLLPFDPQIEIRPGFYVYLDLLFVLPGVVYLWQAIFGKVQIHWRALALGPYFLFAVVTSFWRAENIYWFAGYSARLFVSVLFMIVVATLASAELVTLVLGTTLIPQVLYGVYQLLTNDLGALYVLIYPHYERQPWTDRAYGFFFQPNNWGGYSAIVSIMLLAVALRSNVRRVRIACYSLAGLGFIGLASSGSRGAWLGALAGLVLLFALGRESFRVKMTLTMAAAVGIFVAKFFEYAPLTRVGSLDAFTVEGRSNLYLAAALLFFQHPLIGVGLTNYQELMPSVILWEYGAGNAAHNTYLQILSENGIIGFLLFFGPVFYIFHRSLRNAKQSTAALVGSAGLCVFLVHALFDFQFTTAPQYLLLFAVLFGLASQSVGRPTFDSSIKLDFSTET
jgi:O-antigen ligase